MSKLGKMKRIISTLSLFLFLPTACAIAPFPIAPRYFVDLTNDVCAKYEMIDNVELKYKWVADLPLVADGPCNGLVGLAKDGSLKSQDNWIRDAIKALNK